MKSKLSKPDSMINHKTWHQYKYSEEHTFSSSGKITYVKRSFHNGQILYWEYDSETYPLDEGRPSNARAYSAANRAIVDKP